MTKQAAVGGEGVSWRVGDEREILHTFKISDLDRFAELTGDRNPLHLDGRFADRTAAGGQVVHGMLAAAYVSTLIGMEIPGPGALWNSFSVNWRQMIRIGDTVRFRAKVTNVNSAFNVIELWIQGENKENGQIYLDGSAKVSIMTSNSVRTASTLKGERVLVTGASGVLGEAICKRLAEDGAQLVLMGRNHQRLDSLRQSLGSAVEYVSKCDLEAEADIQEAILTIVRQGGVSGIVHAAAAPLQNISAMDEEACRDLERHWRIDVSALQKLVIGLFGKEKRDGFVIAILTQAVLTPPPPKMATYVTAKMAAWGLIRAFAQELGQRGIRCNAVSPGLMETPYAMNISVRAKQVEAAVNPLRRLCSPEEVADAVVFLAGPQSSFINGINLPVTGGASVS